LILTSACHPEEAESHAKRATPDEGPMHLAVSLSAADRGEIGKGTASSRAAKGHKTMNPASAAEGRVDLAAHNALD
jgi:hypothetical protein